MDKRITRRAAAIKMKHHHILLITLPAQGHVNPTLQLAKRLTSIGAHVTFATTIYGQKSLKSLQTFHGLSYAFFSDGREDEEYHKDGNIATYMERAKTIGAQEVTRLIQTSANEGRPVTLVIYGLLLHWVAQVARELNVPSVFYAVQSATAFAIYHKYFGSRGGINGHIHIIEPSFSIELPDLPLFSSSDLPTLLLPTDKHFAFAASLYEHIKLLEDDPKPCLLINTFDDLEEASIKSIDNMDVISIGPSIPSAFADGSNPADKSFGCDLFDSNNSDYLQWLDSRTPNSVIYVSFGTFAVLTKEQNADILQALLETGRSFLWIIRPSDDEDEAVKAAIQEGSSGEGIILPWCSQVEVLSHKSIGCFVSHCGWNSTLESLVAGVPIVGCPQFSDQTTNIKMVEEVWRIGVRARHNEEGLVQREEIKRCLDILMGGGERGEAIRQNILKWRCLALKAIKEGGSSHKNLKMLLESFG